MAGRRRNAVARQRFLGGDDAHADARQSVAGNIAPARLHFESYAAYGSLGFDITDSLNLTGELRYTRDSRSISARLYDLGTGLPTGGPSRIIDDSINADNLSYNATLSYQLTSNILSYGKRSEEHTSEIQSLMRISYDVFCL